MNAMILSLYKKLGEVPYNEILRMAKRLSVIEGFDFGDYDSGELFIVLNDGDKSTTYNQYADTPNHHPFETFTKECRSRLAAYPHLNYYAQTQGLRLEGTSYLEKYDYRTVNERGKVVDKIEVKCRDDEKYTMLYLFNNRVMLDKKKDREATLYYTLSRDGYGLLFRMEDAVEEKDTTTPKDNERTTEKWVEKKALYFDCKVKRPILNWTPWCVNSAKILGL